MMGSYHLCAISIVLYPGVTFPQILAVVLRDKGRLTVSARFHCLNSDETRQHLEGEKSHWNRTGLESWQKILAKWTGRSEEVDAHANEMKAEINAALAEAARGTMFGYAKVTVIVRDEDRDRAIFRTHNIRKEFAPMGITARIENLHTATAV